MNKSRDKIVNFFNNININKYISRILKKRENKRILTTVFIFLVFIFVYGLIQYYIIFPSRGYFHSDNTDTLYWAEAMYDAKWFYNLDFNYAAFFPFGGAWLMLPFIPIFGVSMTTHIIGMSLFYVLLLLGLYLFLRSIDFNKFWIAIITFVIIFGLSGSDKIREIFYGHIIYYSLGFLFFLLSLAFIFKMEKKLPDLLQGKRLKFVVISAFLFLFFLLSAMNGISVITLSVLPVIGGYFLERFFRKEKFFRKENRYFFINLMIISIGSFLGVVISIYLATIIIQGYANAYSAFTSPDNWMNNVNKFIEHWYTLFGVNILGGEKMNSLPSIINLLRIFTGTLILIFPIIALVNYKKLTNYRIRVLLIAHTIMVILLMMGYVFGLLAAANWRLSPLLASSLLVSMVFLKTLFDKIETRKIALVFIIPFVLNGIVTSYEIAKMPYNYNLEYGKNDVYFLSEKLEELGLSYGYATFWRAQAITVVSDSKVKVRSITNEMDKYVYQGENSWYDDQQDVNQYFLLLTRTEYDSAKNTEFYKLSHTEIVIEGSQTYYVLVFDENIF